MKDLKYGVRALGVCLLTFSLVLLFCGLPISAHAAYGEGQAAPVTEAAVAEAALAEADPAGQGVAEGARAATPEEAPLHVGLGKGTVVGIALGSAVLLAVIFFFSIKKQSLSAFAFWKK